MYSLYVKDFMLLPFLKKYGLRGIPSKTYELLWITWFKAGTYMFKETLEQGLKYVQSSIVSISIVSISIISMVSIVNNEQVNTGL